MTSTQIAHAKVVRLLKNSEDALIREDEALRSRKVNALAHGHPDLQDGSEEVFYAQLLTSEETMVIRVTNGAGVCLLEFPEESTPDFEGIADRLGLGPQVSLLRMEHELNAACRCSSCAAAQEIRESYG